MLYILISTILLLPTFLGIGTLVKKIFPKNTLSLTLFSGIVIISSFWTILAFFIPLNSFVEITTIIVGSFLFFINKFHIPLFQFLKKQTVFFYSTIIISLFFSSFYPFILDHFGYYVPSILWLQQVGLVKGIANLDLILGQMSIWHIFQAGFGHFSDSFFRLNGILVLAFIVYIFEKKNWINLALLPFLYLFSQSPSPDLPVIIFSLIIVNEIIFQKTTSTLFLVLAFWVFTLKPTVIWLPIFTSIYFLFYVKSGIKSFVFSFGILILFFIKNIYCFGFPIFPVTNFNLGLSWQPNPELLQKSSELAIQKTFDMQYSYAEIQKFNLISTIKNWIFLKGIKSFVHISFLLSLFVFCIYTFKKKSSILWILLVSILVKTILVLIFSAQYRFFIEVFFVIFIILFHEILSDKKSQIIYGFGSFFLAISMSFPKIIQTVIPSFNLGYFMGGFKFEQIIKPSVYELKRYETKEIGNLKFHFPKKYPYNFDTTIPSISPSYILEYQEAKIFPQLNGKEWKEGFHWKKLNNKELEELKIITKDFSEQ